MNDRFKFKVYNKDSKELIEVHDPYELHIEGKQRWFLMKCNSLVCNFMNGELIQCTGLRDKNGKLIYEGDIVKRFEKTPRAGKLETFFGISGEPQAREVVVEWDEEWKIYKIEMHPEIRLNGLEFICGKDSIDLEIIGNIYENPELLKN